MSLPFLCFCLSVSLSFRLSVYLSLCLSVSLSLYLSVSLSLCRSISLSLCRSISLSLCLSVSCHFSLSIGLSVSLSGRLTVCLAVWLFMQLLFNQPRPLQPPQPHTKKISHSYIEISEGSICRAHMFFFLRIFSTWRENAGRRVRIHTHAHARTHAHTYIHASRHTHIKGLERITQTTYESFIAMICPHTRT